MKDVAVLCCVYVGIGFTVLGVVIDNEFLGRVAVRFWSVGLVVLPFVIASVSFGDNEVAPNTPCTSLTDSQAASLEVFRLANASCTYNLTVGPGGVTIN